MFCPNQNEACQFVHMSKTCLLQNEASFFIPKDWTVDFIFLFRPRSLGGCYTTGFVQNTNINWVNSKIGACPGGPFKGAVWNNVTIYVREDDVSIQLDGKHLVTTKSHFPSR